MKNFYILLITVSVLVFTAVKTNAQTIAVQISQTDSIIKTCANNRYTATFNLGSGIHHLDINAFLDNNASFLCSTDTVHGIFIDSVQISGNGNSLINDSMNFATGTWSGDIISSNNTCTLNYNIHLDCSMIPNSPNVHAYTLKQLWTDSLSGVNYNINNSNNNAFVNFDVQYPYISDASGTSLPTAAGYLQTIDLPFKYSNINPTDANMVFSFTPDSSLFCGAVDTLGLFYRVGTIGSLISLHPSSEVPILLPADSSLFIIQRIHVINCLPNCHPHVVFKWHCLNSNVISQHFCNNCQSIFNTSYSLGNLLDTGLYIQRILPVSGTNLCCANNINNLVHYEYNIMNPSDAAMDTAVFDLVSQPDKQFLTLIPKSSIHITNRCLTCNIYNIVKADSNIALCSSMVSQPVWDIKIATKNLAKGDTINLQFDTYRCVEDDTTLLHAAKFYEHFSFEHSQIDNKCQVQNANSGLKYSYGTIYGNGLTGASSTDVDYRVNFTPTIADLSSQSNSFGDSALFEIEMKGFDYKYFDGELFGQLNAGDPLKGYLRVTVDCDIGLRMQYPMNDAYFKYDSAGTILRLSPLYYYTNKVNGNICDTGKYYFYYDLSNPAMKTLLKNGFFEYELQSCCNGQNGKRYFNVNFHTQLNPSGTCATLNFNSPNDTIPPICSLGVNGSGCNAWLPLAGVKGGITIHCPGCITPGMIISSYKMQRTSFGLQDSNNDGKADDSLIQINKDSSWFKTNGSNLNLHYSGLGDKLEDKLVSHFQPGDAGAGGYTYAQMFTLDSVQLPYLQLARMIPFGITTMKVIPDSFYLYIDTPDTLPNCVDCNYFGVDSTKYRTQKILKVYGSSVSNYLTWSGHPNYYLYTFESKYSSGVWTGNLHNKGTTSLSVYNDPNDTLKGFFEGQQYRIRTFYSTCGNFLSSNAAPQIEDVRIKSEIKNYMWMSGTPKSDDAFDNDSLQPASLALLHDSAHYTIVADSIHPIIDSVFAAKYIFNCENFDGIHYFFSNNVTNYDWQPGVLSSTGCSKVISIRSTSIIAANLQNVYPYEYRPSILHPKQFTVNVPNHYRIDSAFIHVSIPINNGDSISGTSSIKLPARTGTVVIPTDSLPPFHCLKQSSNVISDTLLYYGSQYTTEFLSFYISPVSCDSTLFISDSSTFKVRYGIINSNCIPSITCGSNDTTLIMNAPYASYHVQPHDSLIFNHTQNNAISNKFCFPIQISNSLVTIDSLASTDAPYYFIALPNTVAMPYFSNWTYIDTVSNVITVIPATGQVIKLDPLLKTDEIHNGWLCADYEKCIPTNIDSIYLPFYFGWNCTGFPATPFNPLAVCGVKEDSLYITKQGTSIKSNQCFPYADKYTLCTAFPITTCYTSNNFGGIYPKTFTLGNLPTGLLLEGVSLSNRCDSATKYSTLFYDSIAHNYPINDSNLIAMGHPNEVLYKDSFICISATYIATCGLAQFNSPSMKLTALSYCGDSLSITDSTNKVASVLLTMGGSQCDSCFTINKTASYSTIAAGDVLDYTIVVCANNRDTTTVFFNELLPSDFTPISTLPNNFLILPQSGCDTIVISGYFNTPGSCPNPAYINTAQIITIQNDTLNNSVCVNVISSCNSTSNTVIADTTLPLNGIQNYNNLTLYFIGTIHINQNIDFMQCMILMAPGAQIIIDSNASVNFHNTIIEGCYTMWKGIFLSDNANISLSEQSEIHDAVIGISSGLFSKINIEVNSSFENCFRGIFYRPLSMGESYHGSLYVTGTKFGLDSVFKPEYPGQQPYSDFPYSGIELNDCYAPVFIGDNGIPNSFSYLNNGIITQRSTAIISNCTFNYIKRNNSYPENWQGSAISGVGSLYNSITNSLDINSSAYGAVYMNQCDRGVYSEYGRLSADNITMDTMKTGIETNYCTNLLSTSITNCIIHANRYGLNLWNNDGAKGIFVDNNYITMSGNINSIGISASEFYVPDPGYSITNNNLLIISGAVGIRLRNIAGAVITNNSIGQTINEDNINSIGISLEGVDRNNISCNDVISDRNYLNSFGISSSNSTNSIYSCNHLLSNSTGVFFGGSCIGTKFIGNTMLFNYLGMYLNSNAVIGKQYNGADQFGNIWDHYRGSIGALNLDTTSVQFSLFRVNTTMGQYTNGTKEYFPVLDSLDLANGWFFPDPSGVPYDCSNNTTCTDNGSSSNSNDNSTLRAIALDSIETLAYNSESKSQEKEYLYEKLKKDPSLAGADIVLANFAVAAAAEPTGDLYDIKEKISKTGYYSPTTIFLIQDADSLIKANKDSINNIEQFKVQDPDELKKSLITRLIALVNTRANLLLLRNGDVSSNLDIAKTKNDVVSPTELPEINEKVINDLYLRFYKEGIEGIRHSYNQLLDIATQCPYAGGKAVYQARPLLALFNDSLIYDDNSVCLQNGIYRLATKNTQQNDIPLEQEIILQPNPAKNQVNVILKNSENGICDITILNSLSIPILTEKMDCKTHSKTIDTELLSEGVYFVKVEKENGWVKTLKLIITR